MALKFTKPEINFREKLAELDKPSGIAGEAMLRAETPQEQFNLIGAGRHRINHNGAMNIWQRGTSFSSVSAPAYHTDRHQTYVSNTATGRSTISRSTDAPSGFGYSYKLEVTTSDTSLAAGAEYGLYHYFEGQDLQGIKKGMPDALPLTFSFWVKSSLTGKFVVELMDNDNSNRHCNRPYYINSANTWEYKTITFPSDTTGVLANDNGNSFHFNFWHGGGSGFSGSSLQENWGALNQAGRADGQVNVYGTNGATWQVTGVQLEVGKVATPFEHRSYGEELHLCQRYLYYVGLQGVNYKYMPCAGTIYTTNNAYTMWKYPRTMRAVPALNYSDATDFQTVSGGAVRNTTAITLSGSSFTDSAVVIFVASGADQGHGVLIRSDENTDVFISFDAEF
jgi:hypothetical protein